MKYIIGERIVEDRDHPRYRATQLIDENLDKYLWIVIEPTKRVPSGSTLFIKNAGTTEEIKYDIDILLELDETNPGYSVDKFMKLIVLK